MNHFHRFFSFENSGETKSKQQRIHRECDDPQPGRISAAAWAACWWSSFSACRLITDYFAHTLQTGFLMIVCQTRTEYIFQPKLDDYQLATVVCACELKTKQRGNLWPPKKRTPNTVSIVFPCFAFASIDLPSITVVLLCGLRLAQRRALHTVLKYHHPL